MAPGTTFDTLELGVRSREAVPRGRMIYRDREQPVPPINDPMVAYDRLFGAGIDVLEEEPPPEDSPVLAAWRDLDHPAHDRLLLNPHAAFYCEEGAADFRTKAAREVLRALSGEPLHNQVN